MSVTQRLQEFLIQNNKGLAFVLDEAQNEFGPFSWTTSLTGNVIVLFQCRIKELENLVLYRKGWKVLYHPVVGIEGTKKFFCQQENKWYSLDENQIWLTSESYDGLDENFEYTLDKSGVLMIKYDRVRDEVSHNVVKDNLVKSLADVRGNKSIKSKSTNTKIESVPETMQDG